MSRVQLTDSAGNVASISSGAIAVTSGAVLTGVNVSSSSLQIVWHGIHVSSSAAAVVVTGVNRSSFSALEVMQHGALYAVSMSNDSIKAAPGVFYGIAASTTGVFEIKDGTAILWKNSLTAGVVQMFNPGIFCATSITISASAGVGTVFYR